MATEARPTTLVGLIVELQALGLEPVRHGRFIGLRGRGVGRVSPALWDELHRLRPQLLRHLRSEPTPYQRRQRVG
jgi:hypothetical protein